jgi:uncharacterized protein (DUF2235 family)
MSRNIVICCDGTDNQIEENNTNVVRLFRCVPHGTLADGTEQRTYYDPGVGTFSAISRSPTGWIGKLLGMAFGWGVRQNVEEAYRYLMDTYEEGDRVYLFGFSRGAFTVRALAGMLHKCGLLTPGSTNLVPYASSLYTGRGNEETAAFFKEHFTRECIPHMIGVFDTVASLGLLYSQLHFFDQKLTPGVRHACHAVAIDEKRPKFSVSLWDEAGEQAERGIEQVWFAGVHSDVGGGYARKGLSDVALEWMLERAECAGLGVDRSGLAFRTDPLAEAHRSLTWPWRLLGIVTGHGLKGENRRVLPPGSAIHASVRQRMQGRPDYDPPLPPEHRFV